MMIDTGIASHSPPEYPKRRYTDHTEKASDHDLLIKLNTKIDLLCKAVYENGKALKAHVETTKKVCDHRIEVCTDRADKKVDSGTFWTFVTIVVLVFTVVFAMSSSNLVGLTEMRQDVKAITFKRGVAE